MGHACRRLAGSADIVRPLMILGPRAPWRGTRAAQAAADAALGKPFDPSELIVLVDRLTGEAVLMELAGTGIADLDLVLGGGLPLGSLIFIAGGSGTGKTILAQEISFANATAERKALYYTLVSERPIVVVLPPTGDKSPHVVAASCGASERSFRRPRPAHWRAGRGARGGSSAAGGCRSWRS